MSDSPRVQEYFNSIFSRESKDMERLEKMLIDGPANEKGSAFNDYFIAECSKILRKVSQKHNECVEYQDQLRPQLIQANEDFTYLKIWLEKANNCFIAGKFDDGHLYRTYKILVQKNFVDNFNEYGAARERLNIKFLKKTMQLEDFRNTMSEDANKIESFFTSPKYMNDEEALRSDSVDLSCKLKCLKTCLIEIGDEIMKLKSDHENLTETYRVLSQDRVFKKFLGYAKGDLQSNEYQEELIAEQRRCEQTEGNNSGSLDEFFDIKKEVKEEIHEEVMLPFPDEEDNLRVIYSTLSFDYHNSSAEIIVPDRVEDHDPNRVVTYDPIVKNELSSEHVDELDPQEILMNLPDTHWCNDSEYDASQSDMSSDYSHDQVDSSSSINQYLVPVIALQRLNLPVAADDPNIPNLGEDVDQLGFQHKLMNLPDTHTSHSDMPANYSHDPVHSLRCPKVPVILLSRLKADNPNTPDLGEEVDRLPSKKVPMNFPITHASHSDMSSNPCPLVPVIVLTRINIPVVSDSSIIPDLGKPVVLNQPNRGRGTSHQRLKLRQRKKTHANRKPYICVSCGKDFWQQCYLIRHIRTHKKENRFVCPCCNQTFKERNILHQHIRIHFDEKPYTCSMCEKMFKRKTLLNSHVQSHHPETL